MTASPSAKKEPVAPTVDADSRSYWEGLAQGRIILQECSSCEKRRFPPMPSCPYCGARGFEVREASGGEVFSWVTVRRAFQPAFAEEVPYTIATVDLDGGGRIVGRLEPAEDVTAGQRVHPRFVAHQGWTELRFQAE
jgi:uncharacterized OB-fold protein